MRRCILQPVPELPVKLPKPAVTVREETRQEIAELPKPAVTEREETHAEKLERSFQEIIKGNRKSSLDKLGLPPPPVAKFQSNGVKKRIQDRTQDWAEGTFERKQKRGREGGGNEE